MGTGKSAVGPLAARALNYEFIDLDRVIERAARKTIPEIFESEGEAGFRDRESAALRQVARGNACVVATGGGVVMREENRTLMAESGHLICLTASVAAIVRRTRRQRGKRPMLGTSGNLTERVKALIAEREPYYKACHHIIDTTGRPADAVAREVVRIHREGAWRTSG